jgi:hypothetical protein
MYQSRKLRSQPAEPAKDSELRVLPFPRISDPAFESLLNELIQRLQNAAGEEESITPKESDEQQLPLPIPPVRIPGATTESLAEESEPSSEERNVQPSAGLSDQEFESLLNDLVQRSQDVFRTANPDGPARREEPQAPLPIPSTLMPDLTVESLSTQFELGREGRDPIMPLLTVLVVSLAMTLGWLLGMHSARNRGDARAVKRHQTTSSVPRVSMPSIGRTATEEDGLGSPPNQAGTTRSQDAHHNVRPQLRPPEGLTVYENDRVVFRLPPEQDTMPKRVRDKPN